ncbi:MAG: di-heme oxidoredictase family protein, partial [Planctomycetota bacterium]
GGGDTRFNAKSIGIEEVQAGGERLFADMSHLLKGLHPGLVVGDSIRLTAVLPHFGGSEAMEALRERYRRESSSDVSKEGGAAAPGDVRENMAAAWHWAGVVNQTSGRIKARLFERNTTSLYGAGLIDLVSDEDLQRVQAKQRRHPEVSGRISTLLDGRFGRFGWRANVGRLIDFVDQACANEMGLETERRSQAVDIAFLDYRNPGIDIQDEQIRRLRDFIAALPAPVERAPDSPAQADVIRRGKQAFEAIGCSVCHVQTLGPANNLYSDLLLHDMGDRLYDFDSAEPHVLRRKVVRGSIPTGRVFTTGYYGRPTSMPRLVSKEKATVLPYTRTPRSNTVTQDEVPLMRIGNGETFFGTSMNVPGKATQQAQEMEEGIVVKRKMLPSNVTQEWRTPPLWGVADSAPYMHDGRAETLLEAIAMHGGEAQGTRERFMNLSFSDRAAVIAFMEVLVAPPSAPKLNSLAGS